MRRQNEEIAGAENIGYVKTEQMNARLQTEAAHDALDALKNAAIARQIRMRLEQRPNRFDQIFMALSFSHDGNHVADSRVGRDAEFSAKARLDDGFGLGNAVVNGMDMLRRQPAEMR